MEVAYKDGVRYQREEFVLENTFEKKVLSQYKHIFGQKAILFDKHKLKSTSGIGTIPDAFVLCPDKKKWYVIEVELASHSVYNHIVPQITKFKVALNGSRRKIVTFFDKEIENDLYRKATWNEATGSATNIYRDVANLIDTEPELIIIIDKNYPELTETKDILGFRTKVLIFKCFNRNHSVSDESIYVFEESQENSRVVTSNRSTRTNSLPEKTENLIVAEVQPSIQITNLYSSSESIRVRAGKSPDPKLWTDSIPELKDVSGLINWKNICLHLNTEVGVDSARRVLKKWVLKNKPDWPPVP